MAGDDKRAPIDVELTVDGAPTTLQVQGRTLVRKGPIAAGRAHMNDASAAPTRDPTKLSIDELARALAPVVVFKGYEYGLEGPDYEVANRVYKALREPPREERANGIIGTDNRVNERNNTLLPQSTYLQSEAECSGVMISRSVALTAAHCVFETGINPNHYEIVTNEPNWRTAEGISRSPRWTKAVDAKDADPFPFVHNFTNTYEVACTAGVAPNCTSVSRTLPGSHMGCYALAFTQEWRDSGGVNGDFFHDYAFVDFGACGGHPGDQGLFMSPILATEAQIEARSATTFGYPKFVNSVTGDAQNGTNVHRIWWQKAPGTPSSVRNAVEAAEIWGMTGVAWTGGVRGTIDETSANSHELRFDMDIQVGQSGSAVWQTYSTVRRVVGVVSRFTSNYNRARRWDATVDSFARANTNFPN